LYSAQSGAQYRRLLVDSSRVVRRVAKRRRLWPRGGNSENGVNWLENLGMPSTPVLCSSGTSDGFAADGPAEANLGQAAQQFRFVTSRPDYALLLHPSGALVRHVGGSIPIAFQGSSRRVEMEGVEALPTGFRELAGDDRVWRFQVVERIGREGAPSFLAYYIRTEMSFKKETHHVLFNVAHPTHLQQMNDTQYSERRPDLESQCQQQEIGAPIGASRRCLRNVSVRSLG
jgi:hypothetical protein